MASFFSLFGDGADAATWDAVDEEIDNATTIGFIGEIGLTLNDMMAFAAGYGSQSSELDDIDDNDTANTAYVNAHITIAPGVGINPEVGILDKGNDSTGTDEGSEVYYGLQWMINF